MLSKIKSFFKGKLEDEEICSLPYTDEYYDLELEKREKRIGLFREKVGDSPMDDIDYIIDNGYDGYHQLQEDCRLEVEEEYKEEEIEDENHYADDTEFKVGDHISVLSNTGWSIGNVEDKVAIYLSNSGLHIKKKPLVLTEAAIS